MINFVLATVGALLATNQPAAPNNSASPQMTKSVIATNSADPVEKEFQRIMQNDDAAEAEIEGWIRENNELSTKGGGVPRAELNQRIRRRFDKVRAEYEDFIQRHPNHAGVRLAFAGLLEDVGDDEEEGVQLAKARELDPKDPAAWNQSGNYFGHLGPITNAFECYMKAIELDRNESVYYENFGTTVYMFRKDAMEYFKINEQQVFDKALMLYSNALRCDPTNFDLASDVLAKSYYGIKPLRTNDALVAWTNALRLASNEGEREDVYLHLARIKMAAGRFTEAHMHLNAVTNEEWVVLKERLARNLAEREEEAKTNAASASGNVKPPAEPPKKSADN